MSTLFELKDEILKGRRVKRKDWLYFYRMDKFIELESTSVDGPDLFSDDWELEPLPEAKKKIKYYAYMSRSSLIFGTGEFHMYFDKEPNNKYGHRIPNLDQEIEVDE